ncbi:MAG: chitobiase/beta-hexosaminidase C-terminal domain-containing protein [Thermodesulfovibrionales bacterium]
MKVDKSYLKIYIVFFVFLMFYPCSSLADTLDNWILSDSGTTENLYGVTYGNGKFVAVGRNGTILTSDNGATWDCEISGTTEYLYAVTYGSNKFVAVGRNGTILTLADGETTWETQSSGITDPPVFNGTIYDNGKFVAVGGEGTIITSDDAVTWTSETKVTGNNLTGVAYGNSKFVVVGYSGTILTLTDGETTWKIKNSGTSNNLQGVTYGNSKFIAVGNSGTIRSSDTGVTWSTENSGTTYALTGVANCNSTFITVGSLGTILTLADGETTWTPRVSVTSQVLWGATYGSGLFVTAGSYGAIPRAHIGSITINGGATYTNSTSATLTLSCDDSTTGGCLQMQFSNDNITWPFPPETYATTKSWTLTSGVGTKTVYVKFQDNAGNWSVAFYNTIVYETSAPTVSASPAGGTYYSAQSVTLTCSDSSGSGCDKIYYTTDGSTPTTGSPVYTSPISIGATTTLKFFATDKAGNQSSTKTETYTITIYPPLTVSTPSLPSGTLGISYSQSLLASGGLPPYSWSLFTGSLPNGLSLSSSGGISGTPTASGTFNFTVRVTDSIASTATKALSITIQTYPVRITGTPPVFYNLIQPSYNGAANNDVIQIQALTFTENLNFNRDISVTLKGGYDYNYTANASNTAVMGTLTISSGTVTIENVSIQ